MMEEAARGRSLFIVTRMGRPQAVVIGVNQYRELLEEIETAKELHDSEYMAGIAEARADFKLGRTLTLDELDKEMGFTEEDLFTQP
jgi:PHD/YefM family antitoxin component YafN of YafNO toxin-antitoxin module